MRRKDIIVVVIVAIFSGVFTGMIGFHAFTHWQFWPIMIALNGFGQYLFVIRPRWNREALHKAELKRKYAEALQLMEDQERLRRALDALDGAISHHEMKDPR